MAFAGGSAGKESTCNVRDLGSIPVLARFPGEGNSYPLQCSGLENSMPWDHKESDMTERLSLSGAEVEKSLRVGAGLHPPPQGARSHSLSPGCGPVHELVST